MQIPLRILIGVLVLAAAGYGLFYLLGDKTPAAQQTAVATTTEVRVEAKEYAETGTDYKIQIKYPSVGIPRIDQQIETELKESADELKAQAVADEAGKMGFATYEFSSDFSADEIYVSDALISIPVTTSWYTGGAHGLPMRIVYNYDRKTLRELTLDDAISLTGLSLEQIASRALAKLTADYGEESIFAEGAEAKPSNYKTFRIDADEVIFIFQPYQAAPYAAGMPEIALKRVK